MSLRLFLFVVGGRRGSLGVYYASGDGAGAGSVSWQEKSVERLKLHTGLMARDEPEIEIISPSNGLNGGVRGGISGTEKEIRLSAISRVKKFY